MADIFFQSFTDTASSVHSSERVAALRSELKRNGLHGFVIPRADEHQNEYVPKCAERLAWLTGFAGSAGLAIVLADKAAICVEGRYTRQVREEVATARCDPQHSIDAPPESWIEANLPADAKLGYDAWLHTQPQAQRLERACKSAGATLVAVDTNPVDAVWNDRPAPPRAAVSL